RGAVHALPRLGPLAGYGVAQPQGPAGGPLGLRLPALVHLARLHAEAVKGKAAMRFVYFTKTLQGLDVKGLVAFCKDVGLDGADLAVRPGYPVEPANAATALPAAAKAFRDAGLTVGLVTAPTDLTDPEGKT